MSDWGVEIKQRATRMLLERGRKEQRGPSKYTMPKKKWDAAPCILIAFSSLLALGAYTQGLVACVVIGYAALTASACRKASPLPHPANPLCMGCLESFRLHQSMLAVGGFELIVKVGRRYALINFLRSLLRRDEEAERMTSLRRLIVTPRAHGKEMNSMVCRTGRFACGLVVA